jgi:hypothetical protein
LKVNRFGDAGSQIDRNDLIPSLRLVTQEWQRHGPVFYLLQISIASTTTPTRARWQAAFVRTQPRVFNWSFAPASPRREPNAQPMLERIGYDQGNRVSFQYTMSELRTVNADRAPIRNTFTFIRLIAGGVGMKIQGSRLRSSIACARATGPNPHELRSARTERLRTRQDRTERSLTTVRREAPDASADCRGLEVCSTC